jgi:hypothetical protein
MHLRLVGRGVRQQQRLGRASYIRLTIHRGTAPPTAGRSGLWTLPGSRPQRSLVPRIGAPAGRDWGLIWGVDRNPAGEELLPSAGKRRKHGKLRRQPNPPQQQVQGRRPAAAAVTEGGAAAAGLPLF